MLSAFLASGNIRKSKGPSEPMTPEEARVRDKDVYKRQIRGNEEMPDATHNTTLPFTRYLAGAGDYTLCYFNNRAVSYTHLDVYKRQA